MNDTISDSLNRDVLDDFQQDFSDIHERCEHILIALEHDSHNTELLNELFRHIHNIKGNLVFIGLKDATPLIQSVEDLLDAIRKERLDYTSMLSDVILLTLDRTQTLVDTRTRGNTGVIAEKQFDELCQHISNIADTAPDAQEAAISRVLTLLDPALYLEAPITTVSGHPSFPIAPADADLHGLLDFYHVTLDADLAFFLSISHALEMRSLYWHGRTLRQLQLGLAMNHLADAPVDPAQLAAAIIMHDAGMAFLPLDLLHKNTCLTAGERMELQAHPEHAATLLRTLQRWDTAARCIAQHHERMDGSGYPAGLRSEAIAPGARLLAIIDTFEARTHERAHSSRTSRPLIRAILEINSCSGNLFDAGWVELFNAVMHEAKAHMRR